MPIRSCDLPANALRELFRASRDRTSPDRKSTCEHWIRRVERENLAMSSITAFELFAVEPATLHLLGYEVHVFDNIVVVVGELDGRDISIVYMLSHSGMVSRRSQHFILLVEHRRGEPQARCLTSIRKFGFEHFLRHYSREHAVNTIRAFAASRQLGSHKIIHNSQLWAAYPTRDLSSSAIKEEGVKTAVPHLASKHKPSLVSSCSGVTFYTAKSGKESVTAKDSSRPRLQMNQYNRLLQSNGVLPVDCWDEQNWSGRGQHVEFQQSESSVINDILEVHDVLGTSRKALVESVRCRRILLARKTVWPERGRRALEKQQAIEEVAHLNRLRHAHIVRLIGSYVVGKQISILLYAVADYNLQSFLPKMRASDTEDVLKNDMFNSSNSFPGCLVNATQYIHSKLVKHMDIKPENVLVRKSSTYEARIYTVLIADFGISRSYESPEAVETDGPTSFTRLYAAPEVINQDLRGCAADIFSLGCVLLELYITRYDTAFYTQTKQHPGLLQRKVMSASPLWETLQCLLRQSSLDTRASSSYAASIGTLQKVIKKKFCSLKLLPTCDSWLPVICNMINRNPKERPTVRQLESTFGKLACCDRGPCMLEAYQEDAVHEGDTTN